MKTIAFLLTMWIPMSTYSQFIEEYQEFPDLFDLYVFGNYEKCLKKSLRYVDSDKYRREPRAYLYAAKSYLKIYNDPETYDHYIEERPLREALKHAARFIKRDEYGEIAKGEKAFLEDLKIATMNEALYQCQQEEYRKSAYFLRRLVKVFPEDHVSHIALSLAQTMNRNRSDAHRNFERTLELMAEKMNKSELKPVNREMRPAVRSYLIEYLDYCEDSDNGKGTIQTLAIAHLLFGDSNTALN